MHRQDVLVLTLAIICTAMATQNPMVLLAMVLSCARLGLLLVVKTRKALPIANETQVTLMRPKGGASCASMLCTDGTNWKQSGMVVLFPTSPHRNSTVWFYSTAKPYTKQAPNVNGRYPSTKVKYSGYGLDAIQWSSITVDGLGLCRRPKLPLVPVCGPVVWCDAQIFSIFPK